MKKIKSLALALGLIIAMPFVLFAEEQEVEIELIEVRSAEQAPPGCQIGG